MYKTYYKSPLGILTLASDGINLTGLWFKNQKYYERTLKEKATINDNLEIFKKTKEWLTKYFNKENPKVTDLSIKIEDTEFRKEIYKILLSIPYSTTTTYKEIGNIYIKEKHIKSMSLQAVGGAIAHNPISIIIPCHRVVGTNDSLTGYAGGIEIKKKLLKLEGINTAKFRKPKKENKNDKIK